MFQALALHNGEVSVVQPLLVAELVLALVLRRGWIRQAVAGTAWTGAAAAGLGLAVFIARGGAARGPPGTDRRSLDCSPSWRAPPSSRCWACWPGAASPARRAALRGAAAGIVWALEAAFIKSATDDAAQGGLAGLFTHWPVYAVAVGGAAGCPA